MNQDKFRELLDELDGNSLSTLKEKNARYSQDGDCLHNFRSGAEIAGGTPAQVCWRYLTKHLVALRDMVEKDNFSNRDDFLEKCQDTINYIRFLWCIGNDENSKKTLSFGNEHTIDICTNTLVIEPSLVEDIDDVIAKMREYLVMNCNKKVVDKYIQDVKSTRPYPIYKAVFYYRVEAERVLNNMKDIIKMNNVVTVSNYYKMTDIHPLTTIDDTTYGWDDLSSVIIDKDATGYYLTNFPDPIKLK